MNFDIKNFFENLKLILNVPIIGNFTVGFCLLILLMFYICLSLIAYLNDLR